jgi:hypothetical protein
MGVTVAIYEASADELEALDAATLRRIIDDRGRRSCSLDKAWDGLYFLFRRGDYDLEAEMLDFERAEKIGGHSVVRIEPGSLSMLADNFSWDGREGHLAKFYVPSEMRGVYPEIWERDGDAARDYLLSFVDGLRKFTDGAAKGSGAIAVMFA